jgi:hypothetical protein
LPAPHQHLVCELHGGVTPRHLAAGHPILRVFTIRWPLHHLLHAVLPRAAVSKALRDFRNNLMVLLRSDCATSRVLPLDLPVFLGGEMRKTSPGKFPADSRRFPLSFSLFSPL